MTKKLVSEFDPEGWKKVQQTMLAHGNAYLVSPVTNPKFKNSWITARKNVAAE
jgi:hypothetical protein